MMINIANGVENFAEIRQTNAYYVDKTKLIEKIIDDGSKVTLITRPRRFGKTITQSMLAHFFDITTDSKADFESLYISKNKELCAKWQNKYPVVFFSLKDVEGTDFESAYNQFVELIADFCLVRDYILVSDKINDEDKALFKRFRLKTATKAEVTNSLFSLTRILSIYYGAEAILLIDEYDVPLAKAAEDGYYEEMVKFIRGLLGKALKSNMYLQFGVLTGCLRISKESIFTGLNNLTIDSITSEQYDECLGFTPAEVNKLLEEAGLADHADEMKTWYDGYRFGNAEVYCPWDVMNHVRALQRNPKVKPLNYWDNTSGNGVVYHFIEKEAINLGDEFEKLMAGKYIVTEVKENLTYDTIESTPEDFWSLLFMTGYLTSVSEDKLAETLTGKEMALCIPNEEVKCIFEDSILTWFKTTVKTMNIKPIFDALWQGKAAEATELLNDLMYHTISYYDYKESYYHAFMAGLFAGGGYKVASNKEAGNGRPDTVVKDVINRQALIFEFKYTKDAIQMDAKSNEALEQIVEQEYIKAAGDDMKKVICYGIAFAGKKCLVKKLEI